MLNSRLLKKASTAVTCTEIPQSGLVASYKLQGTAEDETGTYNGAESGNTYVYNDENGVVSNFDGSTSYVNLPDALISTAGNFSFSMWLNFTTLVDEDRPIELQGGANIRGVSGAIKFNIYDGSTTYVIQTQALSLDTWYHVVCIRDTINGLAMYLDSVLVGTNSYTGVISDDGAGTTNLGRRTDINTSYFEGQMSNVHFYDRALTTTEISSIYNLEKYQHNNALDHGLVAYYPLDGNSLDNGLNQLDGTDTSMTYPTDADMGVVGNFNGTNGNIILSSEPLNPAQTYSFSYFFKRASIPSASEYLVDIDGWTGFSHVDTSGIVNLQAYNGSTWFKASTSASLCDNEWHHIVCIHDLSAKNLIIYVDGIFEDSTTYTGTLASASSNTGIGSTYASTAYFEGQMADVRFYNRILSGKEIDWIYNYEKPASTECKYNSTIDNPDPFGDGSGVALYKMDGNVNDTTGVYDGTPTGITYADGEFGECAVFDGSTSTIEISANPIPKATNVFSISCWYRYNSAITGYFGFGRKSGDSAYNQSYWFRVNGFSFYTGQSQVAITSTVNNRILDAVFHHYTTTCDGTTVTMYIDGIYNNSFALTSEDLLALDAYTNFYGLFEEVGSYGDNGSIGQIRLFNKTLVAEEITILSNERKV
jgi:hypothetical protein